MTDELLERSNKCRASVHDAASRRYGKHVQKAGTDKRRPGRSSKLDGWHAASVQYERGSVGVDPGVEKEELRELVSRPSVHQYKQHAELGRGGGGCTAIINAGADARERTSSTWRRCKPDSGPGRPRPPTSAAIAYQRTEPRAPARRRASRPSMITWTWDARPAGRSRCNDTDGVDCRQRHRQTRAQQTPKHCWPKNKSSREEMKILRT